jgi:DNA-binding beta-propeller fold protein YncE
VSISGALFSRRLALLVGALAALLVSAAAFASAAGAADRVYWTTGGLADSVSFANLDGSGGGNLNTSGATPLNTPHGVAIDAAAGRIYWANYGASKVSFANLDGSGGGGDLNTTGATTFGVFGVAIDPAAGRLYWANTTDGISFANLNGSGGGNLNTSGAALSNPNGVAIDPAAGRIYWANYFIGGISFANLNGSGGGNLNTSGATVANPIGVAIDPAAGRIYWANSNGVVGNRISFANLNGSGGGNLNTTGATVNFPAGVAVDPAAGRIYWANSVSPGAISFANLDGSGGGDLNTSGATVDHPDFPALLKSPSGTGAPSVTGGSRPGSTLGCSQGTWASDLVGSFLYRAPQSFSYAWSNKGSDIAGASASTYKPAAVGNYRCRITASNQAGPTSQTSSLHTVFRLGKLTRNKRKGTATLAVIVPSRGRLVLTGKGVVKQRPARAAETSKTISSAGKVKLQIKAKGRKKRMLDRRGKVKVKLMVKFQPQGGPQGTQVKKVRLLEIR